MYKFSTAEPQPEITSKVGRQMKQFYSDDIKIRLKRLRLLEETLQEEPKLKLQLNLSCKARES